MYGYQFCRCNKLCHNRRISNHKVFNGLAARGKNSVDWFFGFKLHIVVNERGQLLNATLTPGNIDDRIPVPDLLSGLFGKIFADRGYVSQKLASQLLEEFGIQFFAKLSTCTFSNPYIAKLLATVIKCASFICWEGV